MVLIAIVFVGFAVAGIPIKDLQIVNTVAAADKSSVMADSYTVLKLVQGEFQKGEANVSIRDRSSITITLVNSEFNSRSEQEREEKSKQLKGKVVTLMQEMQWSVGETSLTINYTSYKKKFFIVQLTNTIASYHYKVSTRGVDSGTKHSFSIVNKSGKCLDVQSSCQNENGCNVQVWECNGSQQQKWKISESTIQTATGKCLDVNANCQNNNGCDVNIWECNAQTQQQWVVKEILE